MRMLHAHAQTNAQVSNPIEPLLMSLVRGYVDDEDLNNKLHALYQVKWDSDRQDQAWSSLGIAGSDVAAR